MSIEVHEAEGWDADDIGGISSGTFRLAPSWYENALREEQVPDFIEYLKSRGDDEIVHTDIGAKPASWLLGYLDTDEVKPGYTEADLRERLQAYGWLA